MWSGFSYLAAALAWHCRCQEAVDAFSRLPPHHYQTGWVLCCVGRAFFEMVDYPEAAKAFNWARQVGGWVGSVRRLKRWHEVDGLGVDACLGLQRSTAGTGVPSLLHTVCTRRWC